MFTVSAAFGTQCFNNCYISNSETCTACHFRNGPQYYCPADGFEYCADCESGPMPCISGKAPTQMLVRPKARPLTDLGALVDALMPAYREKVKVINEQEHMRLMREVLAGRKLAGCDKSFKAGTINLVIAKLRNYR